MHKILINGLQINNKNSGVQYSAKNLYDELKKHETEDVKFRLLRSSFSGNRLQRIYFENFRLSLYLRNNNFTLYHSPNYVLPFVFKSPSVLTIHDLITLAYPKFCQRESVIYFRLLLSRSIKKANKIIAVSNTVKHDILKHFAVSEDKIVVVYHGVSKIFKKITGSDILKKVRKKYQLPEKYILFVGNIEPKKNLKRLIQSFSTLKKSVQLSHKLVIVGNKGWRYRPIFKIIDKLNMGSEIIFTGYVEEEDLPAIYTMADLFVFPSLYEGFGIPPLESMACETPVLVSNRGALPEITGGNCPMIDPYDIESMANGIHRLLTDEKLKKESIEKGKKWVKQFTWERAATETMKVYKEVADRNKN